MATAICVISLTVSPLPSAIKCLIGAILCYTDKVSHGNCKMCSQYMLLGKSPTHSSFSIDSLLESRNHMKIKLLRVCANDSIQASLLSPKLISLLAVCVPCMAQPSSHPHALPELAFRSWFPLRFSRLKSSVVMARECDGI